MPLLRIEAILRKTRRTYGGQGTCATLVHNRACETFGPVLTVVLTHDCSTVGNHCNGLCFTVLHLTCTGIATNGCQWSIGNPDNGCDAIVFAAEEDWSAS